ncbi:hypothetical protein [Varunaivibrio sulfuroxidans]|uniref:Uncharacterized protein n=1 Tax=Varunaivibrio sulfuroxidans TaxID=1773489 RepID=A0A4R3J7H1_9PROT|nr:hypothetical protein [Varunaivibrio sulfuroxidans]TCS61305.1 hypothetical protein EDD55_108105 [Varunaivibrio sulfuroxidans]WES31080.1 hypothetical protein P3M64_01495 [Varunaivibrio sulfuroxidans]
MKRILPIAIFFIFGSFAVTGTVPGLTLVSHARAQAPADTPTDRLFAAINANDLGKVKEAVAAGADLEAFNAQDIQPIDLAINKGAFDIAQYLLDVHDGKIAVSPPEPNTALSPPPPPTPTPPNTVPTPTKTPKEPFNGDVLDSAPALKEAQKEADSIDSAQSTAAVKSLQKEIKANKDVPPSQRGEKPVRFFQSLVDYFFAPKTPSAGKTKHTDTQVSALPKTAASVKHAAPSTPPETVPSSSPSVTPPPAKGNGITEEQIIKELSTVPPNASSPAALNVPMPSVPPSAAQTPNAKTPTATTSSLGASPRVQTGPTTSSEKTPRSLSALDAKVPLQATNTTGDVTGEKPVDIQAYRDKIMPSDAQLSKILRLVLQGKGNTPEAYAITGGKSQTGVTEAPTPDVAVPGAQSAASSSSQPPPSTPTSTATEQIGPKELDALLATLPDQPVTGKTFNPLDRTPLKNTATPPSPNVNPSGKIKAAATQPTLPTLPATIVKDHGPGATIPPETEALTTRPTPPNADAGWDVKSVQTAKLSPNDVIGKPIKALGKLLDGAALGITDSARLGAPISPTMLSNLDQHDSCVSKQGKDIIFCVVPVTWPSNLAKDFQVDTIMYQGTKTIVRYDNERASSYQTLFLSKAFDAVVSHYIDLYGPPTRKLARAIAPLAQKRRDNPVVIWQSKEAGTGDVVTLEIRKFDDTGGSFPDLQRGVILLYRSSSAPIFPVISKLDLMVLKTSVAPITKPTPQSVW